MIRMTKLKRTRSMHTTKEHGTHAQNICLVKPAWASSFNASTLIIDAKHERNESISYRTVAIVTLKSQDSSSEEPTAHVKEELT